MSAPACIAAQARAYVPRAPTETVWNRVLRQHLETFLEAEKDPNDPSSGVPDFVERELRDTISCGSPALGFLRIRCSDCHHEMRVPYSCHGRAACPSCGARRMAEMAATLVDRVLPDVGLRQWVVTAPFELHGLLLADASFLQAFIGIVVTTIFSHLGAKGVTLGIDGGRTGAVTFVQRASSALGAFPHLHILVLDGLYTKNAEASPPVFHALPPPSARDEEIVSTAVCLRVEALLRRRGLVDSDRGPADRPSSQLERWYARASEQRAQLATVDPEGEPTARPSARGRPPSTGAVAGFSVNARTAVQAGDREGRERLARYVARPPFADAQLKEVAGGRIAFELSRPRWSGETHVLFEPLALIRRIAWMIPPPGKHVATYRGVLAPAARWRAEIVPIEVKLRHEPMPKASSGSVEIRESPRIAWARLLARTWGVDALKCERCGGRMQVLAALIDPSVVRKILEHLGLPTAPPALAPARWPP